MANGIPFTTTLNDTQNEVAPPMVHLAQQDPPGGWAAQGAEVPKEVGGRARVPLVDPSGWGMAPPEWTASLLSLRGGTSSRALRRSSSNSRWDPLLLWLGDDEVITGNMCGAR